MSETLLGLSNKTPRKLATELGLSLFKTSGRVLDIDWLLHDLSYLREMRRICLQIGSPEFNLWASELEQLALARAEELPEGTQNIELDRRAEIDLELDIQ